MPIPMMPDGKCSYIVSAVNGKPGWFAVFRNVEMESSPKLRGLFISFPCGRIPKRNLFRSNKWKRLSTTIVGPRHLMQYRR